MYVALFINHFLFISRFNLAADELKIPKIMQDLKDKKANKGAKAFFQVKIRGEPTPVVKW